MAPDVVTLVQTRSAVACDSSIHGVPLFLSLILQPSRPRFSYSSFQLIPFSCLPLLLPSISAFPVFFPFTSSLK